MQGNLAVKSRKSLFLFETVGTFFLTIMYRVFLQASGGAGPLPFFFAFWMITMLTIRVSGAHYNPAISFAWMLKPGNEDVFPKALGLLYIGAQVLGAFLGALVSFFLLEDGGKLVVISGYVFQALCLEIICSFLMVLVFVILNEEDDESRQSETVKKEASLMSMFWTVAFGCCLAMTVYITSGSLNPAVAFGIEMTMLMNGKSIGDFWIYLPMPFVGAVLALMFYQLVYLKTKSD